MAAVQLLQPVEPPLLWQQPRLLSANASTPSMLLLVPVMNCSCRSVNA
ncbi:hypothetical protein [Candidatus Amarolinea dominans]